jgi:hypothetical protein
MATSSKPQQEATFKEQFTADEFNQGENPKMEVT